MVSSPTCPGDAELLALVVGEEPSEELREHLDACPKCLGRLERLRTEVAVVRERPPESALVTFHRERAGSGIRDGQRPRERPGRNRALGSGGILGNS